MFLALAAPYAAVPLYVNNVSASDDDEDSDEGEEGGEFALEAKTAWTLVGGVSAGW